MATIEIRRKHSLSRHAARGAAEQLAEKVEQRLNVRWRWEGEQMRLEAASGVAKGATGVVRLGDGEVSVAITLPLLLSPMRGAVEGQLGAKLDALLAAGGR